MADDPKNPKTSEEHLVDCAANGKFWEPEKVDGKEPDMDPANAATWNNRTFCADMIRRLAIGDPALDKNNPWSKRKRPLLIRGARICGELDLRGATVARDIWLEHCAFDDIVLLSDSKTKTVSFLGSLLSQGLRAKRATIEGSLYLNNGFVAKNEVNLEDVTIRGNLECSNGKFRRGEREQTKHALVADNAKIGGDVRLNIDVDAPPKTGFEASGDVRFVGAAVMGDFNCRGGVFRNTGNAAIDASGLTCRNLYLSRDFVAEGGVKLVGVRTIGQITCLGGTFSNKGEFALVLRFADIGSALIFKKADDETSDIKPASILGGLDLSQVKCRVFRDCNEAWPQGGELRLDGFTYEYFHDSPTDWETRLAWLQRQKSDQKSGTFSPQPWTQAIKVLHDMGCDLDSRQLAVRRDIKIAHHRHGWTISLGKRSFRIGSLWDVFLHFAVGYGYKPWHAFCWSVGFFAFGWLTFATAANLGYMAPRQSGAQIYLVGQDKPPLPVHYTEFNAPLYALDVYLPIVELGQDQEWEPSDTRTGLPQTAQEGWWATRLALGQDWIVTAVPTPSDVMPLTGLAWFAQWAFECGLHRVIYWVIVVLGWIFVSLFIAGMSGIMKRE